MMPQQTESTVYSILTVNIDYFAIAVILLPCHFLVGSNCESQFMFLRLIFITLYPGNYLVVNELVAIQLSIVPTFYFGSLGFG